MVGNNICEGGRDRVNCEAVASDSLSDPTNSSEAGLAPHSCPYLSLGSWASVIPCWSVIGCGLPLGKRHNLKRGSPFRPGAILRADCMGEASTADIPGAGKMSASTLRSTCLGRAPLCWPQPVITNLNGDNTWHLLNAERRPISRINLLEASF